MSAGWFEVDGDDNSPDLALRLSGVNAVTRQGSTLIVTMGSINYTASYESDPEAKAAYARILAALRETP